MPRYGMVIDLKRCVGCHACSISCKVAHGTSFGIFWNRVYEIEEGKYPSVRRYSLPRLCMHCENAPCVEVCPTGASSRRADGIVLVDQEKCVGCKYCMVACPYGARYLNEKAEGYFSRELTPYEEQAYKQHRVGVVQKCNFCAERLEIGKQPACVATCIGKARYFGDLDNPDSQVARLIRDKHGFQLQKELGTNPSVYYLPA